MAHYLTLQLASITFFKLLCAFFNTGFTFSKWTLKLSKMWLSTAVNSQWQCSSEMLHFSFWFICSVKCTKLNYSNSSKITQTESRLLQSIFNWFDWLKWVQIRSISNPVSVDDALAVPTIKNNLLCSVKTQELFPCTVLRAIEPQSGTNKESSSQQFQLMISTLTVCASEQRHTDTKYHIKTNGGKVISHRKGAIFFKEGHQMWTVVICISLSWEK